MTNKKLELFKKSIIGKHIAVLGIGISNTPLIKFLVKLGAQVTAFDKKESSQLGEIYKELKGIGISFSLGQNYLKHLNHEIIFKTPGMRFDLPELLEARKKGSIVTSEMEVFFDLCPAKIIAVTGSDGKTTTTTLIYKILKAQGYTCWLGGNIGKPLLSDIESIHPNHKVILELSSFQLHTMQSSPSIAIITNIAPNHLDVHKSMLEYVEAKKNIFLHQSSGYKLILNYDNKITKGFQKETKSEVVFFSRLNNIKQGIQLKEDHIVVKNQDDFEPILNINDILIPGVHNIENYMAAIGAVYDMVHINSIQTVAKNFGGVEHRIELVRELNGIKFYNDSIASSPTRTIAGLNSFKQKVILIAGGYDKQIPFELLGKEIIKKVKKLVLVGKTSTKIEEAVLDASNNQDELPIIIKCSNLQEAVQEAYKNTLAGDIITLSPACASFDMFKNFEERGNTYKEIVEGL